MNIRLVIGLLSMFLVGPAFGVGMPKIPGLGGKTEDAASADSTARADVPTAEMAQEKLVISFQSSLTHFITAQDFLAKALGVADVASSSQADADSLASGGCDNSCSDRVIKQSDATQEAIDEAMDKASELDAESKALYAQALPSYLMGTNEMVGLVSTGKDWMGAAQGEIKRAGFTGGLKMKKKLDPGMYVAKRVPKLAKTFGAATKGVISFGKAQNLDTSAANDADF